LAAFPAIRDRLKAKIDKYVAAAEKLVNQVFEVFKKAVAAIIDFMAQAVDTLLGALQAVYNFVLDAINFIVAGIIKIMEGLANLISSAMAMPDNFMGQISEEFLGMDVTQPLPFENSNERSCKLSVRFLRVC
jgi:phage-related protein